MKIDWRRWAKIEWLYLGLALVLPWIALHQPPDSIGDYLPIREDIRAHLFDPTHWISADRAYRVPGYGLFLAMLSFISRSEIWIRLVQGLILFHSLIIGKRLATRLGANPRVFAWAWTITGVHFYFSQLILSETLATWVLLNALTFAYERQPKGWLEGLNAAFMVLLKPAFSMLLPLFFWRFWRKKMAIAVLLAVIVSWGFALKPQAGKWVFLGAGGGLNLFISTLPGTFQFEGDALDQYWLREQRKFGHPADNGWYVYDEVLKKEAMSRFPHWNFTSERLISPFFGRQYKRGLQKDLLPFGIVLIFGLLCALRFRLPLISLFFLGSFAMHWVIAPFARFVVPLVPLAALMIAHTWAESEARLRERVKARPSRASARAPSTAEKPVS